MGTNWTNSFAKSKPGHVGKPVASRANIEFYNINTKKAFAFKGFLTSFNDTYSVNFNEEAAYGRMDPFRIYQNTTRVMSLAWDVPAWDSDEAQANLAAASELIKMLYPSYKKTPAAKSTAIIGSPLIRLKFANLIQQGGGGGTVETNGLAGYIPSLSITPVVADGYFEERTADRKKPGQAAQSAKATLRLYPKLLQINCSFNVIHEHGLGWNGAEGWRGAATGDERYPYNVDEGYIEGDLSKDMKETDQFVALPGSIAGTSGGDALAGGGLAVLPGDPRVADTGELDGDKKKQAALLAVTSTA